MTALAVDIRDTYVVSAFVKDLIEKVDESRVMFAWRRRP